MQGWIEQEQDTFMPTWLKAGLSAKCGYCGSPMLNYYNEDSRCTNRKCSNPNCYGFTAARMDFVRKLVGIEGAGFATCLKDAQSFKVTSPFELLHAWHVKPAVTLDKFLRMHCFEGIDSEWEKIVKGMNLYTLDDLYQNYDGKWKGLLDEHKSEIYNNLQYVNLIVPNIQHRDKSEVYTIMITGTPNGFNSKEHFIDALNEACNGYITILHQKTKRQSGVDFLIREPGSTTRGKVEAAQKGGIPIVTSEQFTQFLIERKRSLILEESKTT